MPGPHLRASKGMRKAQKNGWSDSVLESQFWTPIRRLRIISSYKRSHFGIQIWIPQRDGAFGAGALAKNGFCEQVRQVPRLSWLCPTLLFDHTVLRPGTLLRIREVLSAQPVFGLDFGLHSGSSIRASFLGRQPVACGFSGARIATIAETSESCRSEFPLDMCYCERRKFWVPQCNCATEKVTPGKT